MKKVKSRILAAAAAVLLLLAVAIPAAAKGASYLNSEYKIVETVKFLPYKVYYDKDGALICKGAFVNPYKKDVPVTYSTARITGLDKSGRPVVIADAHTGTPFKETIPANGSKNITLRYPKGNYNEVNLNEIHDLNCDAIMDFSL